MPAEGVPWLPRTTLLTPEELMRIVRIAVREGIEEVRLTGGEPLLRPDCVDVVAAIASVEPRRIVKKYKYRHSGREILLFGSDFDCREYRLGFPVVRQSNSRQRQVSLGIYRQRSSRIGY